MQSRMQNPAVVLSDAMQPIQQLFKAVHSGGVDGQTLELVHLRDRKSTRQNSSHS